MTGKVTPRVDLAFKKLFGVEENKDLLISLINSIVSEEDQASEVELLNPYNPKNFWGDKYSILDIKARSAAGKYYNIEIQLIDEADYDKRALYYWAKLYAAQLREGVGYSKLNKTIGIHILNFRSIPLIEKYHNIFHLVEKESKTHHFKDIELHTIELSKFEDSKPGEELNEEEEITLLLKKVKTSLDRWVAFLTKCDLLSNKKCPQELKDPQLEKALGVLEVMNLNEEEREAYEGRLKWLRAEESALKKIGTESFAHGKAEGKAERDIEITKNLLEKGMNKSDISTVTGLSISEVEEIERGLARVQ